MRTILNWLKDIEGLWSLWLLAKGNIVMFSAIFATVAGPLVYLWRYVQLAAINVGWWVYPFVFALVLAAFSGTVALSLILLGRLSVTVRRESNERFDLAARSLVLATEIAQFLTEYRAEENQLSERERKDFFNLCATDGEISEFARHERAKFEDRLAARFTDRYQQRVSQTVAEARMFIRVERASLWFMTHSINGMSILEYINLLNMIAVKLKQGQSREP